MAHPSNKVKPREPRVPAYRRSGYARKRLEAFVRECREKAEHDKDIWVLEAVQKFHKDMIDIFDGRIPESKRI